MSNKSKLSLAAELLKIKAVKLQPEQPFTWASGWKSPFYCDNRKTLSFPALRTRVKLGLANLILQEFPEADIVAGVATGAIAQGALVAEELAKPFVYVRPKAKDHGMGNQIEGDVFPGAKVVVVEDLVSTGLSSLPFLYYRRLLLKLKSFCQKMRLRLFLLLLSVSYLLERQNLLPFLE